MDCPSEERMIRMKLDGIQEIVKLEFDLQNRVLDVIHSKQNQEIANRLKSLDLGSEHKKTIGFDETLIHHDDRHQTKLLWWVLLINFSFFLIEMVTGFIAESMSLVADSLDMLADSVVYGLSLWVVGAAVLKKKKVAKISGYFQITLALLGFSEIIRRVFLHEAAPDYKIMIVVSVFALAANAVSMFILSKTKSNDAHIVASKIFTSNDVIINIGVIVAGVSVMLTNSFIPDLIVGGIVFVVVIRGALRILKL